MSRMNRSKRVKRRALVQFARFCAFCHGRLNGTRPIGSGSLRAATPILGSLGRFVSYFPSRRKYASRAVAMCWRKAQ